MERIKPVTIGIIALLLILLAFSFTLKKPKPQETTDYSQQQTPKHHTTLATNNTELLQKNIDFLQQHLEQIKVEAQSKTLAQPPQIQASQTQNPKLDSNFCMRNKPQLAIIIDDIGTFAQYQAITQIPFKFTPSLFPKSKANPDTPKIAKIAPFYMIHLPLEALNFYQKEHQWLFVGDSKEKIESHIQTIKQDFPNLSYINNHTGSKFTQDLESMSLLLETLKTHRINFVDSKTIGTTKTNAVYAKSPYVAFNPCQQTPLKRDVFLDNILEIPTITEQLIQAVQIAKQKGYAIAIGHPHKATLLALKNATNYLENSGVELVYINEIITP
ncbi:divergent polysaccharide deacetylase family protein [Helicobacter sp.]|uniref:divergent polysaccharide deacetylase family protein n=1 Tax=Helicobacter sp. TaxID=218 RepID=UPI0025C30454|nr:divergent polysaccharide deacetylase family protein [Helicobacter sp.]MCI5969250.1 divergent polysaccharide deacetylase family protein [Helicobacter sp.]MDY2585505.1 divergent polysaccharide deacetylase family protein [Helicobacter sp.]